MSVIGQQLPEGAGTWGEAGRPGGTGGQLHGEALSPACSRDYGASPGQGWRGAWEKELQPPQLKDPDRRVQNRNQAPGETGGAPRKGKSPRRCKTQPPHLRPTPEPPMHRAGANSELSLKRTAKAKGRRLTEVSLHARPSCGPDATEGRRTRGDREEGARSEEERTLREPAPR